MCEVLDRVEKRGVERGIEQGIERGIEALILDNIENGFDKATIVSKVVKRFGASEVEAEEYYDRFALQPV